MVYPNIPNKDFFRSMWETLVNLLLNSNFKLSRIAPSGAKIEPNFPIESNMDLIFSIENDPEENDFYKKLIGILKQNLSEQDKIKFFNKEKIVHIELGIGGKYNLKMLKEEEFDENYKSILDFRV